MTLLLAAAGGVLIGLSLGALGGGGSILAVPLLVHLLGQSAAQATTGSLVVVGVTSLAGALTAHRAGNVLLGRGLAFGVVGIGGATLGAKASAHVPGPVLLAAFSALMLLVGGLMAVRQVRHVRAAAGGLHTPRPALDDPIVGFRAGFVCDCPRAVKALVAATAVGVLTGLLGVGGGFLVVPALTLALAMSPVYAAGTSLVVITVTSAAALAVRAGVGPAPDWGVVAALTTAAAVGAFAGAQHAARADTSRLSAAFTVLVLGVAGYTAARALPALPALL